MQKQVSITGTRTFRIWLICSRFLICFPVSRPADNLQLLEVEFLPFFLQGDFIHTLESENGGGRHTLGLL